ncbi:hypothetical protein L484_014596 [Morus notabilis]|uniref:Uncharacterized protein n=1 Tax=Morus notabilis TaxID=981085 RepID=W9QYR7_9ROSA|nr:hypothetical protein L484_014596 [Morus notabilis]
MAESDHWCWNNFNSLKPWFGNQPQKTGVSSKLQALFKDFMEETHQYMERLDEKLTKSNAMVEDSFATLKKIEAMEKQIEELVASTPSKDVPIGYKQDCLLEEYTPCEEHLKVFDDDSKFEDSSSEKEIEDLIIEEESQEQVYEARLIVSTPVQVLELKGWFQFEKVSKH